VRGTETRREVEHYNLDVTISVGYRVNLSVGLSSAFGRHSVYGTICQGFALDDVRLAEGRPESLLR